MTIKYLDPTTRTPVTVILKLSVVNMNTILAELNRIHNVTEGNPVHLNVQNQTLIQLALFQKLNINLHYN